VRASQKLVAELFDHYFEHMDMPGRWGESARAAADLSSRARIVSDFIAGMTDPYAIEQHGLIFGK
jgi:dGTPase